MVTSAGASVRRYFTNINVLVKVNIEIVHVVLESGVLWGLQTSKKSH